MNKDTPQSNTDWERLMSLFGATEQEAKFLAKVLSNDNVSETILDIRQLLEAEKKRWREEVEGMKQSGVFPHEHSHNQALQTAVTKLQELLPTNDRSV